MLRPTLPRLIALATTTAAAGLLAATPAGAHVDPAPASVPAGSAATVGFTVEHGCETSPTTSVSIQIPPEITDAAPVELAGWTGVVVGDKLTFTGGPLDPSTPQMFSIAFTAPTTVGLLRFPMIQRCEVGEIAWVALQLEGQAEPETPAPTLEITAATVGAEVATAATAAPEAGTATTAAAIDASPSDNGSKIGLIIGGIVGLAVVAGGVFALSRRS